jgi:hypothetical protein
MRMPPVRSRPAVPIPKLAGAGPTAWSRRRVMRTALGVTTVGIAGIGLRRAGRVRADGAAPVPIPGGSPAIVALTGQLFHVYGPAAPDFDPPDAEPSTITDFNGEIGLAYIDGLCRRTDTTTGAVRELPFVGSDMRFMRGAYRGVDGQVHRGTFAFI